MVQTRAQIKAQEKVRWVETEEQRLSACREVGFRPWQGMSSAPAAPPPPAPGPSASSSSTEGGLAIPLPPRPGPSSSSSSDSDAPSTWPSTPFASMPKDLGGALPSSIPCVSPALGNMATPTKVLPQGVVPSGSESPPVAARETSEVSRRLREDEKRLKEPWFGGRVFEVEVKEIMRAIGGTEMVSEVEKVRGEEQDPAARDAAWAHFAVEEAAVGRQDATKTASGHWLNGMVPEVGPFLCIRDANVLMPAMNVQPSGHDGRQLVWRASRDRSLGPYTHEQKCRKPDALLTVSHAPPPGELTWQWPLVLAEFTATKVDQAVSDRLHEKLFQIVFNLYDLLTQQPWRIFALGIAVCSGTLYVVLHDFECVRLARVDRCWSPAGFAHFAAIVHVLGRARLHELGLSPMFDYDEHLVPRRFVGHRLHPSPSVTDLEVRIPPLFHVVSWPFSRGTLVLARAEDETDGSGVFYIVKVQKVENGRARREASVVKQLWQGVDPGPDAEAGGELPRLVFDFASAPLRHQITDEELKAAQQRRPGRGQKKGDLIRRHVEVLVYSTSIRGRRLLERRPGPISSLFDHMIQLVDLIELADQRGVLHRDISTNNILVATTVPTSGKPTAKTILIDWDCAAIVGRADAQTPSSQRRTGTKDTMAVATLLNGAKAGFVHQARYDLESAIYVAVKIVAQGIRLAKVEEWEEAFNAMKWGTELDADTLGRVRKTFWMKNGTLDDAEAALRRLEGAAGIRTLFLDLSALGAVGFGTANDEHFAAAFEPKTPLGFPDLCSKVREVFSRAKANETAWWRDLWAEAHKERIRA